MFSQVRVIDSHTGGEPTRVVVEGAPDLGRGTLVERRERFARDCDAFRAGVVNEPRGSDVIVGALLCKPHDPTCDVGVIFFNNIGPLWGCGHGTIGVAATLFHLGRAKAGPLRIETPTGVLDVVIEADGHHSTIRNVESFRTQHAVAVDVPGIGRVTGDVAWGGNWFLLCEDHRQRVAYDNVEQLTNAAWQIRQALVAANITGESGGEIDHIELFGAPIASGANSKSFVLCPGKAYDRSPCGTGTSAKLACLAASGKLRPGDRWRQESIVGSIFEGWVEPAPRGVFPYIRGAAYVTAEATLLFDPDDPFRFGIRP